MRLHPTRVVSSLLLIAFISTSVTPAFALRPAGLEEQPEKNKKAVVARLTESTPPVPSLFPAGNMPKTSPQPISASTGLEEARGITRHLPGPVRRVAFTRKLEAPNLLVAAAGDWIWTFDWTSGNVLKKFPMEEEVLAVTLSATEHPVLVVTPTMAVRPNAHYARLQDFRKDGLSFTVGLPAASRLYPHSLAFSPDRRRLLVTGRDLPTARVQNLAPEDSGKYPPDGILARMTPRQGRPISGAFHPAGRTVALGTSLGTVELWRLPDPSQTGSRPERLAEITNGGEAVRVPFFSPDGEYLATGDAGGQVRLWRWDEGSGKLDPLYVLSSGSGKPIHSISFLPVPVEDKAAPGGKARDVLLSSGVVAAAGQDGQVYFWDTVSGRPLAVLRPKDSAPILSISFSPDGSKIAAGRANNTLGLWDVPKSITQWAASLPRPPSSTTATAGLEEGTDLDFQRVKAEALWDETGFPQAVGDAQARAASASRSSEGIRHLVVLTFDPVLGAEAEAAVGNWKSGRGRVQVTSASSIMEAGRPIRQPSAESPPVDAVAIIAGEGVNPVQLQGFLEAVVRDQAIQTILISSPKLSGDILSRIQSLMATGRLRNVEADLSADTIFSELPPALGEVDAALRASHAGLEELPSVWMAGHGDRLSIDATNNVGAAFRERSRALGADKLTLNPASIGTWLASGDSEALDLISRVNPALRGEARVWAVMELLAKEHFKHIEVSVELPPTDVYPFVPDLNSKAGLPFVTMDDPQRGNYLVRPKFRLASMFGKNEMFQEPSHPATSDQAFMVRESMVRTWLRKALEIARWGEEVYQQNGARNALLGETRDLGGNATVKIGNTAGLAPWLGEEMARGIGVDVFHALAIAGISRNFTLGFTQEDADQAIRANWVSPREKQTILMKPLDLLRGDLDALTDALMEILRRSQGLAPTDREIAQRQGVRPGAGRAYHSHFASRVDIQADKMRVQLKQAGLSDDAINWFATVDTLFVLLSRFNDELPAANAERGGHGVRMIPASLGTKLPASQKPYHYLLWLFGAGPQVVPTSPEAAVNAFNEYAGDFTPRKLAGLRRRMDNAKKSYARTVSQGAAPIGAAANALGLLLGRPEGLGTQQHAAEVVYEILEFRGNQPDLYKKLYSPLYPEGDDKFLRPHLKAIAQMDSPAPAAGLEEIGSAPIRHEVVPEFTEQFLSGRIPSGASASLLELGAISHPQLATQWIGAVVVAAGLPGSGLGIDVVARTHAIDHADLLAQEVQHRAAQYRDRLLHHINFETKGLTPGGLQADKTSGAPDGVRTPTVSDVLEFTKAFIDGRAGSSSIQMEGPGVETFGMFPDEARALMVATHIDPEREAAVLKSHGVATLEEFLNPSLQVDHLARRVAELNGVAPHKLDITILTGDDSEIEALRKLQETYPEMQIDRVTGGTVQPAFAATLGVRDGRVRLFLRRSGVTEAVFNAVLAGIFSADGALAIFGVVSEEVKNGHDQRYTWSTHVLEQMKALRPDDWEEIRDGRTKDGKPKLFSSRQVREEVVGAYTFVTEGRTDQRLPFDVPGIRETDGDTYEVHTLSFAGNADHPGSGYLWMSQDAYFVTPTMVPDVEPAAGLEETLLSQGENLPEQGGSLKEIEKLLGITVAPSVYQRYPEDRYEAFFKASPASTASSRGIGILVIRSKENNGQEERFLVKSPNNAGEILAAQYASDEGMGPGVLHASSQAIIEEELPVGYELASRGLLLSLRETADFGRQLADVFFKMDTQGRYLYFSKIPQTHLFLLDSEKQRFRIAMVDWSNAFVGPTAQTESNRLRALEQLVFVVKTYLRKPKHNVLAWKNFEVRLKELEAEDHPYTDPEKGLLGKLRRRLTVEDINPDERASWTEFFRMTDKQHVLAEIRVAITGTNRVSRVSGEGVREVVEESAEVILQGQRTIRLKVLHEKSLLVDSEVAQAIARDLFERGYLGEKISRPWIRVVGLLESYLKAHKVTPSVIEQVRRVLARVRPLGSVVSSPGEIQVLVRRTLHRRVSESGRLSEGFVRFLLAGEIQSISIRVATLAGMGNREYGETWEIYLEGNPEVKIKEYVIKAPHKGNEPSRSSLASELDLGPHVVFTRSFGGEKPAVIVEDLLPPERNIGQVDPEEFDNEQARSLLAEDLAVKIYTMIRPRRKTVLHAFDNRPAHIFVLGEEAEYRFLMIDWALSNRLDHWSWGSGSEGIAKHLSNIFLGLYYEFEKFGPLFWMEFQRNLIAIAHNTDGAWEGEIRSGFERMLDELIEWRTRKVLSQTLLADAFEGLSKIWSLDLTEAQAARVREALEEVIRSPKGLYPEARRAKAQETLSILSAQPHPAPPLSSTGSGLAVIPSATASPSGLEETVTVAEARAEVSSAEALARGAATPAEERISDIQAVNAGNQLARAQAEAQRMSPSDAGPAMILPETGPVVADPVTHAMQDMYEFGKYWDVPEASLPGLPRLVMADASEKPNVRRLAQALAIMAERSGGTPGQPAKTVEFRLVLEQSWADSVVAEVAAVNVAAAEILRTRLVLYDGAREDGAEQARWDALSQLAEAAGAKGEALRLLQTGRIEKVSELSVERILMLRAYFTEGGLQFVTEDAFDRLRVFLEAA